MASGPLLIGWKEYADFPAWQLSRVKVKIDTGARTSALGAVSYELRPSQEGVLVAELHLDLHRRRPAAVAVVHVPVLRMVVVSNSSGVREERPLVETEIRVGPVVKRILLTVTNRAGMRFPVILGRKALENDFVVDVSRKYVSRRRSARGRKDRRTEPRPGGEG